MNRREATAAASQQLRFGYFDHGPAGPVYVTCAAPCREKVTIDPSRPRAETSERLLQALTDHLMEEH